MKVEKGDVVLGTIEILDPESFKGPLPGEKAVEKNREHLYVAQESNIPGFIFLGKEEGEFEEEVDGTKVFGPRRDDLMVVMNEKRFVKLSGKRPVRGMSVVLETEKGPLAGRVMSVTSGRVVLDFNHPLAGQKFKVKGTIEKILKSPMEKLSAAFNKVEEGDVPIITLEVKPGEELRVLGYIQTAYRMAPQQEMEFRIKVKGSSAQKP